jgi:hypothetical protein
MTNENTNQEPVDEQSEKYDQLVEDFKRYAEDMQEFHTNILTDMITLKQLIYDGRSVPAYRDIQKISDKIKTKIVES